MSDIVEKLKGLFGRGQGSSAPDEPDPELAYVLYWMKTAREWPAGRRAEVEGAVKEIVERPDFSPNTFSRRYQVTGLDDSQHAGASLLALLKVLDGLEAFQSLDEESKA